MKIETEKTIMEDYKKWLKETQQKDSQFAFDFFMALKSSNRLQND